MNSGQRVQLAIIGLRILVPRKFLTVGVIIVDDRLVKLGCDE
jgi:hypothetical protein